MSEPEAREPTGRDSADGVQAAVELRGVGLRYFSANGEMEALRDISLRVDRGEFVSIIGPSGCGKSTVLSVIAGILRPTVGDVTVFGQAVTAPSRRVGYMLQQDYLLEWRTVLQNVLLGAEIHGVDLAVAHGRALSLLSQCGLATVANALPRELSGGMRQRVALARTLCTEPDVVLLDEPFSALDSQTRLALADEVTAVLRQAGKTAILVTHDIGEAVSMSERVIVMSRGPGRVKGEHPIRFGTSRDDNESRPSPMAARSAPNFGAYFEALWRELDVHVRN